jgi:LacI family transcriptional regulator
MRKVETTKEKKRQLRRKVTLKDVAKRAQVSMSSVSRVIHDYPGVHLDLRSRVEEAMREVHYLPLSNKQRRGKSPKHVFYFLLTNRDLNVAPHSKIMQAIERETSRRGDLLVYKSFRLDAQTPPEELNIAHTLELTDHASRGTPVGGVILTGLSYPNLVQTLESLGINCVVLGNNYVASEELNTDAVYFDGYHGAYDSTRYLLDLGHTNILFIGDPNIGWFSSLHKGYLQALGEAGLKPIAQTKTLSDSFYSNGYLSVEMAFEQTDQISAIMGGCDEIGLGAWKALNDRNLSVPRDVSLVGFDDEDYAAFTVPPLTTVRIDVEAIGRELIGLLYKKLSSPSIALPVVTVPTVLIKRGTCRPLVTFARSAK